jgi:DNA-binding XRE family transcriptional regulator
MNNLRKRTGITHPTFYKILKWEKRQQTKILDIIYKFFKEPRDAYYYSCFKYRNKQEWKNLWSIIRKIRIFNWISLDKFAYKAKISKKQLIQIEKSNVLPFLSTLELIIDTFDIPFDDRNSLIEIWKNEKVIENLLEKYQL